MSLEYPLDIVGRFIPLLLTILISIAVLWILNGTMRRRWGKNPDAQFRFQLIQTEFRDLVTVPNLYLVTPPLRVVRASGTIISAEVSLGYDVPRMDVADMLCKAAADSHSALGAAT